MLLAKSRLPAHGKNVRCAGAWCSLQVLIGGIEAPARRADPALSRLCTLNNDAVMRGIWLVLGYHLVGLVRLDLNIARIAGLAEGLKSRTGLRRGERDGDGNLRTSVASSSEAAANAAAVLRANRSTNTPQRLSALMSYLLAWP